MGMVSWLEFRGPGGLLPSLASSAVLALCVSTMICWALGYRQQWFATLAGLSAILTVVLIEALRCLYAPGLSYSDAWLLLSLLTPVGCVESAALLGWAVYLFCKRDESSWNKPLSFCFLALTFAVVANVMLGHETAATYEMWLAGNDDLYYYPTEVYVVLLGLIISSALAALFGGVERYLSLEEYDGPCDTRL